MIKYLAELRQTEMWLAPIAGTRLMVPYRVTLPTPLGQGVLQATQFVTAAAVAAPDADQRPVATIGGSPGRNSGVRRGLMAPVKCAGTFGSPFT